MDFHLSPEDEQLRRELRDFLARELPPGFRGSTTLGDGEDVEVMRDLRWKLAERGWLALGWPREWGGGGASALTQTVFNEEMAYQRAPGIDVQGVKQLGPIIIRYGTEEQKRRHLPPILRADVQWCQGYSEPGSGSDLASVQTWAVVDGDDFVVTGAKIWTSRAHYADWMYLLVRTNPDAPKHKGISFLLVDMRSPGITVRPIVNMVGSHVFNEVRLDGVRVPRENLVGELDRGWYVATALLELERSGVEYPAHARRALDDLVAFARERTWNGCTLAFHPLVRYRLADRYVEVEAGRWMAYHVAWLQTQGQSAANEASRSKLLGTEALQRTAQDGMRILGLYGQLGPDDPWAPLQGTLQRLYLASVSTTIGAGTSEVQRNIIATRELGLPRG